MLHQELSHDIIKAFYQVYNGLGFGFLEKVYERALIVELQKMGISARRQVAVDVFYSGENVGFYLADVIVNDKIIIEIIAGECLAEPHEAQLLNYLKATNIEIGLLLGFCRKPEFRRKVFNNEFKQLLKDRN